MTVHAWSVFEEIIRYLKNMEIDNKKCVFQEHLSAMAPTVGKRMYSQELTVRAFQYFATSRSSYNRLRIDYQLPPIKILTRITLKESTLNETCFIRSAFNTVKENQKQCVTMQDEIYVKKNVVLSWGNFVWKSDWWSSIPCKNFIRSYDILHVWWTHIYLENVAHWKIEFVISLWINKTYNWYHQSIIGYSESCYLRWQQK